MTLGYADLINALKSKFGAEIIEAITSIPDTATFIEFIYEEAVQTILFAIYIAHKYGQDQIAQDALTYLKLELLPDAKAFVDTWGDLAPWTKNCFKRFFDAAEFSASIWDEVLSATKQEEGALRVYANVEGASVYVDGELKGTTDPYDGLLMRLPAGSHGVEVRKDGYQTAARQVNIDPGEYQVLKVNLIPAE